MKLCLKRRGERCVSVRKGAVSKADKLSPIPITHMVEGKNWSPLVVLWLPTHATVLTPHPTLHRDEWNWKNILLWTSTCSPCMNHLSCVLSNPCSHVKYKRQFQQLISGCQSQENTAALIHKWKRLSYCFMVLKITGDAEVRCALGNWQTARASRSAVTPVVPILKINCHCPKNLNVKTDNSPLLASTGLVNYKS